MALSPPPRASCVHVIAVSEAWRARALIWLRNGGLVPKSVLQQPFPAPVRLIATNSPGYFDWATSYVFLKEVTSRPVQHWSHEALAVRARAVKGRHVPVLVTPTRSKR